MYLDNSKITYDEANEFLKKRKEEEKLLRNRGESEGKIKEDSQKANKDLMEDILSKSVLVDSETSYNGFLGLYNILYPHYLYIGFPEYSTIEKEYGKDIYFRVNRVDNGVIEILGKKSEILDLVPVSNIAHDFRKKIDDNQNKKVENNEKVTDILSRGSEYKVQSGDTIWKIVEKQYGKELHKDFQAVNEIIREFMGEIEAKENDPKIKEKLKKLIDRLNKTNGDLIIHPGDVLLLPNIDYIKTKLLDRKAQKENLKQKQLFEKAKKYYSGKDKIIEGLKKDFGVEDTNRDYTEELFNKIINFQMTNNLKVNGIVGVKTFKKQEEKQKEKRESIINNNKQKGMLV